MKNKGLRFLYRLVIGLILLAVLLSIIGVYEVRHSFPQVNGEVRLAGLEGPVEVYRDALGIPQIYASSLHDLFMSQGYLHAQDRFWQMDFWRHIGSGRLSEMFGKSELETDSFLRTLGWSHVAEQELSSYDAESIAILQAYADGVNAYLVDHQGTAISLEYGILKILTPNYKPEPWTPLNTLTWAKAMAWDLRGNMDEEIERAVLLKALRPEQVAQLFPPYPADHPTIVQGLGQASGASSSTQSLPEVDWSNVQARLSGLDALLGPSGSGIGSNSWVVAGSRTATGKPLLANDPHLSIQMPSIWYQIGLHCQPVSQACPYQVAGFSFAGVPGVVIGHNNRIAWGFTNTGPDVMDLYIEKINPDNPNQYEVNGKWVDMIVRTETIQVGGGAPVTLNVRSTRHGPIISDVYGDLANFNVKAGVTLPDKYAIALRWTALEPSTIFQAIWGFNKAQNWEDFRQAARKFNVPAQNLLYADVDGNIGYQMPGNIPIRRSGDGTLPVPGWTDKYEWTGYIPFDQLPHELNPASGYIVTANNEVVGTGYPYLITADWDYGFRAQRIVQMIETAPGPIDITYFQHMQNDTYNENAATLVPILTGLKFEAGSPAQAQAIDLLGNWDFRDQADSQAAAIFESFWSDLLTKTFTDEAIPQDYWPAGGSRWYQVMRELVNTPDSPWWDNKATMDTVETRDDLFTIVFTETITRLEKEYGREVSRWPVWGELHTATFRNQSLGTSGIAPIEALFNRGPFPTSGGESIVNATGWKVGASFAVDWLPSMRMIVDLSNLSNSVTIHTTGQSGHAFAPHYVDMAPLWANARYAPMLWEQQDILDQKQGLLNLVP
jgi:penicillin amidase